VVGSQAHRSIFWDGLSDDSTAAGSWETASGSSYYAAGVGATITGRRADLGIIDDPVKSREEADSELTRQKHWDWYVNDFKTRLKPNYRQLHIQTRWHEDDLAGRILATEGDKWRVLKLPMVAGLDDPLGRAPGDRLWPEWFTAEMVDEARRDERSFSALYQQDPSPQTGTFFKREWFWFYKPDETKLVRKYLTSDFAFTENGGDFTEIGIHGVYQDRGETKLYLCLDGWYGQQDQVNWAEEYMTLVARHRPVVEFGEGGMTRRASEGLLTRVRRERKAPGGKIEWMPSVSDKVARAASLRAMASMGRVGLPDNDYGHRVLAQLLGFPAGKHDDAVDMVAMMARAIDQAHPAMALGAKPTVVKDRWDKVFDGDEGGSWRV
jgi:predicted phage terminase large subunit-like protein